MTNIGPLRWTRDGRMRTAFVALTLVVVAACGDAGYYVQVRNSTSEQVVVAEDRIGQSSNPITLQPGDKISRYWMTPQDAGDQRKAKVMARAAGGELIYCEQFGWRDLERVSFSITIDRVVRCSPNRP